MTSKYELIQKIRNLSINENEIDRFPPEIDELALLVSRDICDTISREMNIIQLSLHNWARLQAIIQVRLVHTIREIKFTPPSYPPDMEIR